MILEFFYLVQRQKIALGLISPPTISWGNFGKKDQRQLTEIDANASWCSNRHHQQTTGWTTPRFWEPLEALIEQINSCEATNISGERQFAKIKVIQQKAPTMSVTKIENRKMFDSAVVWNELIPYVSFINTSIFCSICSSFLICTRLFRRVSYHSTCITYWQLSPPFHQVPVKQTLLYISFLSAWCSNSQASQTPSLGLPLYMMELPLQVDTNIDFVIIRLNNTCEYVCAIFLMQRFDYNMCNAIFNL